MSNWIGRQLGNYRLIRQLGKGGFGQVYLGEHIYLQTHAAIKLLLEDVEPKHLDAFRAAFSVEEARRIATLKHPHILRVLDFGIEASTPYLIMEYAAGGTLLDRHDRGARVPIEQVVRYTKQIALALHYAHEARLIHRDVKPANVLLDEKDTVLLSDFGIATIAHRTSTMRTSKYAGTAAYTAPEQLMGKPVPASDQYALAIMVYEWLCGELPYQGAPHEVGVQHLMAPIPSLCEHNDTLSPNIEGVVHQAMAKDSKQRFVTIVDFADTLEQVYQPDSSSSVNPYAVTVLTSTQQMKKQLFEQGNLQLKMDQFLEALTTFEKIVQIDAKDVLAYTGKGRALLELKRYEEALAAYERAVQLAPTNAVYHNDKGNALKNLKRYEEALAAYERAVQLVPTNASYHNNKGLTFYVLERYEEALVGFERAIELIPTEAVYHHNKGDTLKNLKRYEEALAAYERAVQLNPTNADYHKNKREILDNLKKKYSL